MAPGLNPNDVRRRRLGACYGMHCHDRTRRTEQELVTIGASSCLHEVGDALGRSRTHLSHAA